MSHETISRRSILVGATALVASSPLRTLAQGPRTGDPRDEGPELWLLLGLDRDPRERRLRSHDRGEQRNASDAPQAGQRYPAGDGLPQCRACPVGRPGKRSPHWRAGPRSTCMKPGVKPEAEEPDLVGSSAPRLYSGLCAEADVYPAAGSAGCVVVLAASAKLTTALRRSSSPRPTA